MAKYVYRFSEGDKDQKELLGGKGANLAEMTNLGMPVPPGFTISTDACRAYLSEGRLPRAVKVETTIAMREVEEAVGRNFGDPHEPLLVSVRSGAKFSMPGMMETVLNVGLNDETVEALAKFSDDERFAWDSYRRLIQMFGRTVLDIPGEPFSDALDARKEKVGATTDLELGAEDLKDVVSAYKDIVKEHTGEDFPQDPRQQLELAIEAVFRSWNTERARLYRRRERIPHHLGTAVNVVSMVFGNLGETSGTGVCFTRDPSSGHSGVYGDYLQNAQGEDVVSGIRNTLQLADLEQIDPKSYKQLRKIMRRLETHYRDLCDIEFTIEQGKLWMLQTRIGKRTAGAAFRIACQLDDEGLITTDEALQRVTGNQLSQLLFPQFDAKAERELLAKGLGASPGAAVGAIVFDNAQAAEEKEKGNDVILVRRETSPEDLPGMVASKGVLTTRGGKTSHAAVVARGMGMCAVVGAESITVHDDELRVDDKVLKRGDVIAIDGATGEVFVGDVPVVDSPVMTYIADGIEAAHAAAGDDQEVRELVDAVHRLLSHADDVRRLRVRANADNGEDAARARKHGAEGIGLCRTEHQFLGDRRVQIERVVLSETGEERDAGAGGPAAAAAAGLHRAARGDGRAADHDPADRPAAPRVPARPPRPRGQGGGRGGARRARPARREAARRRTPDARVQPDARPARGAARAADAGPVLAADPGDRRGLRRAPQAGQGPAAGDHGAAGRVAAGAAAGARRGGGDPEGDLRGDRRGAGLRDRLHDRAATGRAHLGPDRGGGRLLLLRHQRPHADHVGVLARRRRGRVLRDVPGERRAHDLPVRDARRRRRRPAGQGRGRGRPVDEAGAEDGRLRRARRRPESIHFFHDAGLDYVSCSPFRVPVARLEAGRATVVPKGGE